MNRSQEDPPGRRFLEPTTRMCRVLGSAFYPVRGNARALFERFIDFAPKERSEPPRRSRPSGRFCHIFVNPSGSLG